MDASFLPLLLMVVLSIGFGALLLGLSRWLGPRRDSAVKSEPFEAGNPVSGMVRGRFNVKFYLVAILFLVFDLEIVFVYPWAVVFSDAVRGETDAVTPLAAGAAMAVFALILVVSLIYEWRKGALEWNDPAHTEAMRIPHVSRAQGDAP